MLCRDFDYLFSHFNTRRVTEEGNEGLADLFKPLMKKTALKPIFDAVLIDEGQDLVADPIELNYEDKQAIYWMAYQSLRPCDPKQPEERRLIWAYDEAQNLDTLKIPTSKELFGEELSQLLSKGRQYKSGINKSKVMHRCYRTRGEILTAAHAIGMGLLRPEGMLSGLTTKAEWESIGLKFRDLLEKGKK